MALAAVAASVALITGCAPAPPQLPEGLPLKDIIEIRDQGNAQWWDSMFPGEPAPYVPIVAYLDPSGPGTEVTDCVLAANIPGVSAQSIGYSFEGTDPILLDMFYRAQYTCTLSYPYGPEYAGDMGIMSDGQLEYLFAYFTERLAPCLRLMGYEVAGQPSHSYFMATAPYLSWMPYYSMSPQPMSATEWDRVDARCPAPPIGPQHRPAPDDYHSP